MIASHVFCHFVTIPMFPLPSPVFNLSDCLASEDQEPMGTLLHVSFG